MRTTDPVRGTCSAYGGHETAEVHDVWRIDGGAGCVWRAGKRVHECLLDDLKASGINADQ